MIKIKSEKENYGIELPTSLNEITAEYFDKLLADIKVAKNYCIIAVCTVDNLFACVNNYKNRTNGMSNVIPLIAKPNGMDANVGDIAFIESSALERGLHYRVKSNVISYSHVGDYCTKDNELYTSIMKGTYFNSGLYTGAENAKQKSPACYFIDFKIVPFIDIKAVQAKDSNPECIYKKYDNCIN